MNLRERRVWIPLAIVGCLGISIVGAAVAASFLMPMHPPQHAYPEASFDFDYDDSINVSRGTEFVDSPEGGVLTITHESGDSMTDSNVTVRDEDGHEAGFGTEVSPGNSLSLAVDEDDSIWVVYTVDSDRMALARWDGPEA